MQHDLARQGQKSAGSGRSACVTMSWVQIKKKVDRADQEEALAKPYPRKLKRRDFSPN
ncbi:MAG: hypothetical protein HWE39_06295 [Oceanospirillaceae bacterium]|nr:hypothetical protein [Oceanospirillaceae bacterium]